MTAQPEHDLPTEPFWIVQSVFDPDDPWRDFAYTIGLAGRGLPELHIYCHPSLGMIRRRTGDSARGTWGLS